MAERDLGDEQAALGPAVVGVAGSHVSARLAAYRSLSRLRSR